MEQHNFNKQHTLINLVFEYEAMSQKGVVVFYEEAVYSNLIDYYQDERNYDKALSVIDTALSQHQLSAFLYYKKAKLLSRLCHESSMQDALDAIDYAVQLSPDDLVIQLFKTELLAKQGNHFQSFSLLTELKERTIFNNRIDLADIYFCEGLIQENLKEQESAFYAWKEALLLNTRHIGVMQKIWISTEQNNKHEASIDLFKQVLDMDPYCHLAWFYLGHAYSYLGQYKEAIEAYEYAFIIDNEFEWAYKECAANCLIMKDYNKALECYKEALKFVEPDGDLLFQIGQCYQYLGHDEAALNFYYKAKDIDAYNDEVFFNMGRCMAKKKKWSAAISYLKKAISLDGRREEYFSTLGLLYYEVNELERAFECFDKATELAPEEPTFWVDFATFLFNLGYTEEALEVLDTADIHSVGTELQYCRVACLHKLGADKEAIEVLADALIEDCKKHTLLFDLIPTLRTNKKYTSAITYYLEEQMN